MISKELNDWLQVVGLFGVLGGLIFVGLQLQLDRRIAVLDGVARDSDGERHWAELVSVNADAWVKGLSGESLTPAEAATFDSLARARELDFFTRWNRTRELGTADGVRWVRGFALEAHTNPGLLDFWRRWEQHLDHVRPVDPIPWRGLVSDEIARLNESSSLADGG